MNLIDLLNWAEQMKNQQTLDSAGRIAMNGATRGNDVPFDEYTGMNYGPYSGAVRGEGAAYRAQNGFHYDPFADENPNAWRGSIAGITAKNRALTPQMGSNAPINPVIDRQSILNAFIR